MIECQEETRDGQCLLYIGCSCGAPAMKYSSPAGFQANTFEPQECSCGDNIHVKFTGDSYTVRDHMLRQVYPPQDTMAAQLAALTKRFDEMAATVVAMRSEMEQMRDPVKHADPYKPRTVVNGELIPDYEDSILIPRGRVVDEDDEAGEPIQKSWTREHMTEIVRNRIFNALQKHIGDPYDATLVIQTLKAAMPEITGSAVAPPFNNDEAAEKLLQYISELDAAPGHCVPGLPTISEERKPYSCRCCKTALWLDEASKPCWRCGGIA